MKHLMKQVELAGGRWIYVPDGHAALHTAGLVFGSNLRAEVYRQKEGHDLVPRLGLGEKLAELDLGSGLTTNLFSQALMNDWNWASPSGAAVNTLKLANYHASGVGTNAAAATDIQIQTAITGTPTTGTTGTQSFITAANSQKYQTVATIAYGSNNAVTEWGLLTGATYSASTGSPFTAGTATTGTVTGTPLTASSTTVQGQQMTIFKDTTNATPFYGLVISNTTSQITVPAWYVVTNGNLSGSNPANADAYTIQPVMIDHKVFSAINVTGGTDSIVFTYQLTIASGG